MTAKEKFKLKQFVKELEGYRGRHTELVTVYVPQGYELNKITEHLFQEQGTATNIKSKSTRDNVITALEKMIQHLKTYPKTPPHGLAAFSGNVAEREGQQDYKVWSIEPPLPMKQRLYRCDKVFVLDVLQDMLDDDIMFGMIVLDKREGNLALLKGKTIIPLVKSGSAVPGKHKTGGQSAARFERLRDGAALEFYKRMAEHAKDEFLGKNEIKGILVGGPGKSKEEFIEKSGLTNELKQKIIAVKDLGYTGDFGLQELLDKCDDVLAKEEVMHEKRLMHQFFEHLSKDTGLAAYGQEEVLRAIKMGAADTVLISEIIDDATVADIEEKAEAMSTKVEIISVETREGVQLKDIGKIAAILRYKIDH